MPDEMGGAGGGTGTSWWDRLWNDPEKIKRIGSQLGAAGAGALQGRGWRGSLAGFSQGLSAGGSAYDKSKIEQAQAKIAGIKGSMPATAHLPESVLKEMIDQGMIPKDMMTWIRQQSGGAPPGAPPAAPARPPGVVPPPGGPGAPPPIQTPPGPPGGPPGGAPNPLIAQAAAAIRAGRDPTQVIIRLQQAGVDVSKIDPRLLGL